MNAIVYADHAATAPLCTSAYQAMLPWLQDEYGNPSTAYVLGRNPRKAIASAREDIAGAIGASAKEIFFTSGGTEADNLAIKGTAFCYPARRRHLITSAIEHHAVLNTFAFLERLGYDVTYLPVDRFGNVSHEILRTAIRPETILISIMTANNEMGTVEPVSELARIAKEEGIPFHTDAVQAVGHMPIQVDELGVQMLSASAHKFGGPKGTGFLYVRKGTRMEPLIHGGGQENGLRSGTENVAGIVGMAAALKEQISMMQKNCSYLENLRERLLAHLLNMGADYLVNGSDRHIPGSVSISFRNTDAEMMMYCLDQMGIEVATGSACNSRETVVSHVVEAVGIPEEYARGTVRITLGPENTPEQIDYMATGIQKVLFRG